MHGCYHDSRLQSAGMMIRLVNQRVAGAWLRGANLYIALTEFSRRKLADAGLPVERLVVKPNFFGMEAYGNDHERAYALFIGRISEEKGIGTLLDALVSMPDVPLKVVGDGALLPRYRSVVQARGIRHIEFLGGLDRRGTLGLLRNARCLIVPSLWYEGFPMVVVEAYAHGVPVVASRLGSLAEIVEHDRTGRHFEAGNAEDLAAQVRWFWQWPEKGSALAAQARVEYEKRYTPDRNYAELMSIYENAIASVGARINAQVQSSAPERAERSNA
jgi:glycosyltransferase involved in cell wall biosynthesis